MAIPAYKANELYGVIVGLHGDPADQRSTGAPISEAFDRVSWTDYAPSTQLTILAWSRLLLVEILQPYDTDLTFPKLALVLRPWALWLYANGSNVADYTGNSVSPALIGQGTDYTVPKIYAPYQRGDVIRIGTLPAPVSLANWTSNGFTRNSALLNETFTHAGSVRAHTLAINDFNILGGAYSSKYSTFQASEVLYYDKNVDARARTTASVTSTGETVNLTVCVGGVTSVYQVQGVKIS